MCGVLGFLVLGTPVARRVQVLSFSGGEIDKCKCAKLLGASHSFVVNHA